MSSIAERDNDGETSDDNTERLLSREEILELYGSDAMEARGATPLDPVFFTGSCYCGKVEFELVSPADKVILCHCLECTNSRGAPYRIMAKYYDGQITNDHVRIKRGEEHTKFYTIRENVETNPHLHDAKYKQFCGECGCTLWNVYRQGVDRWYFVMTSLLEEGIEALGPPTVEYQTSERPSYLQSLPGVEQLEDDVCVE